MKKLLLLSALFFSFQNYAATCTAVLTGDWHNATTWSCGREPSCGDSLVIPAGIVVTVAEQEDYTGCGGPIKINIFGTLTFETGKKLGLACGSEIWVQPGGKVTGGGGGGSSNLIDICGTTVWTTDYGDVNGYAYMSPNSVMPIELKAFYALPQGNSILIHWETATETNNKEFTIEQSKDGAKFASLATIASKGNHGNSLVPLSYEFNDGKPLPGTSYYRLKQTDYNGKFEYFQVISVDMERSQHITFMVYPNPNQGQFTVDFTGVENNHEIDVILYDQSGKLVYHRSILSESLATNTFRIIPEQQIASGNYMVNFVVEGVKYPIKVIVQ